MDERQGPRNHGQTHQIPRQQTGQLPRQQTHQIPRQQPRQGAEPRQAATHQYTGRSPRRRRRRGRKTALRIVVLAVAVLAILGSAWGITLLLRGNAETQPPSSTPAPTLQHTPYAEMQPQDGPAYAWMPEVEDHQWNQVGPLVQRTALAEVVRPDYKMIALPENGRISMEFFNGAAIFGDSLAQGFAPSGIHHSGYDILVDTSARLHTYRGVGPKQMFDGSLQTNQHGVEEAPMDALVASAPDNVYVMMGANAMHNSSDDGVILEYYGAMLDTLRERLGPDVGIYVQSVTPVTSGNTAGFDIDRIRGFNNYLAKMVWEKGLFFLDLHEALADDEGWLRGEFAAGDGYHLNKTGYLAWLDYLLTHTVYNARHSYMYLEGSQYYEAQPRPEQPEG